MLHEAVTGQASHSAGSPLFQLVYVSNSVIPAGQCGTELASILAASQPRNARRSITGYLVNDGRVFMQILEGSESAVRSLAEHIRTDPRHCDMRIIAETRVVARSFPEWSMGGWLCTADTLGIFVRHGLAGVSDLAKITAAEVLSLARELRDFQTTRLKVAG